MQDAVSVGGKQVDDLPEARRDLTADDRQRFPTIARSASISSSSRASVGMPPGRSRTGLSSTRHKQDRHWLRDQQLAAYRDLVGHYAQFSMEISRAHPCTAVE